MKEDFKEGTKEDIMDISQLNIRGRMAYGLVCVAAYMEHVGIDVSPYQDAFDVLAQYMAAVNLAEWDACAKAQIYDDCSDEAQWGIMETILDDLYWIGAGELYGQPSDCKESERLLNKLLAVLGAAGVAPPHMEPFVRYRLDNPASVDEYFGEPFAFSLTQ